MRRVNEFKFGNGSGLLMEGCGVTLIMAPSQFVDIKHNQSIVLYSLPNNTRNSLAFALFGLALFLFGGIEMDKSPPMFVGVCGLFFFAIYTLNRHHATHMIFTLHSREKRVSLEIICKQFLYETSSCEEMVTTVSLCEQRTKRTRVITYLLNVNGKQYTCLSDNIAALVSAVRNTLIYGDSTFVPPPLEPNQIQTHQIAPLPFNGPLTNSNFENQHSGSQTRAQQITPVHEYDSNSYSSDYESKYNNLKVDAVASAQPIRYSNYSSTSTSSDSLTINNEHVPMGSRNGLYPQNLPITHSYNPQYREYGN